MPPHWSWDWRMDCCEMCGYTWQHDSLKYAIHSEMWRQWQAVVTEELRLRRLLQNVLWFNFEVTARDLAAPWRESNPASMLVLTGLAAGRKGPCTLPDDAAPSAPPGHRPGPRPLLRSPARRPSSWQACGGLRSPSRAAPKLSGAPPATARPLSGRGRRVFRCGAPPATAGLAGPRLLARWCPLTAPLRRRVLGLGF